MARNTHRANCANARRPGCKCSGCGGSLHGWQGWTALAADLPQVRDERRRELEGDVRTNGRFGGLGYNAQNRRAYLDLARLDITDYLWTTDTRSKLDVGLPRATVTADPASISSDSERMKALAEVIMEDAWPEVSADIDNLVQEEPNVRQVKKGLANHAWCSLLVALIQLIERIDKAIDLLNDAARTFVKRVLSRYFESGISQAVTDAVINIVVNRVWSGLTRLLEAHFPLLGSDTLRVLRMLAVFTCPSVDDHPDVYKHAVEPLFGDARKVITEEIRGPLIALFTEWWRRRGPELAI